MKGTIKERLNFMISCGYPIFILGDTVVLPIEAEDFFADEEMNELKKYILSNR